MTDKQIIIDGVEVYKCRNAKRSIFGIDVECQLGGDCSQRPNCYYKQLKRKEQECEELKKWLPIVTRLEMAFGSIETEKAKAIDYNTYAEEIFRQLDQLKAENKHLNDLLNQALKELEKTRETLTEIKEIAEEIGDECQLAPYGACALEAKDQILQKISECEENDE